MEIIRTKLREEYEFWTAVKKGNPFYYNWKHNELLVETKDEFFVLPAETFLGYFKELPFGHTPLGVMHALEHLGVAVFFEGWRDYITPGYLEELAARVNLDVIWE